MRMLFGGAVIGPPVPQPPPADRIGPDDVHLGSFVVREGRWLVWHMYRRPT